jgi:hypothetical protein
MVGALQEASRTANLLALAAAGLQTEVAAGSAEQTLGASASA